jgi:hypothetical protein
MAHRTILLDIGNDQNLRLADLRHVLSGTLITSANIIFSIVLSGSVTGVSGQSWPSSMTLVNTETALWVGPLLSSLALTEGGAYEARITANAGTGVLGFWRLPIKAIVRDN